ncbi:hypothetical protein GQ42DRAFT_40283 [Ramicandelaber brevisporus]|nr:hypothetical protein GQ42DRAFT_40283 [Ramicandelaber brevisporus]
MSTTMSYFRLFDLPLDLLELLTLYFEGSEAVKVLTVSSNFHDIFARSVWHLTSREAIDVAEPTRSSAFARYGHLVRWISLLGTFHSAFNSLNWAQLFPNTTVMAFDIVYDMEYGNKQMLMDNIASLHGLRSLKIDMDGNMPPFDLKTLAKVLVARHRDPNKQSLRDLTVAFGAGEYNYSYGDEKKLWSELGALVHTLSPLRPSIDLQIDMGEYNCIMAPTPVQMDLPRPYITSTPYLDKIENEDGCMALHNQQLFSPSGTCDNPLVFGRLGILSINVCCASPLLFDYSDFTPTKFPAMERMYITEIKCSHQVEGGAGSMIQTLLLQKWPKLKDLHVGSSGLTLSTLDKLIELNPQLTAVRTNINRNIGDADGEFMLERVAGCLPNLTTFYIYGGSAALVDSSWLQTASLVDIRSSKLACISFTASMLTSRLFDVLLALPSLRDVSFWQCILVEAKLVMSVFKRYRQTAKKNTTVGVRRLTISTPEVNNNWSTELVLEMISSLPHLKSCNICGDTVIKNAIKKKHPKLCR